MEPKLFQIYLTEEQQIGYDAYIADNFSVNDRIASAVWRKAMQEFLIKRGYMKEDKEDKEDREDTITSIS